MSKEIDKKKTIGRPPLYIDDVGVILTVGVPSKQKSSFKKVILAMRKEFEIKK